MTSLLTSSPPISILHQLFWCRYSNSRDIAESSPCSSRHAARATRRACLQAGSMIDFRTFAYVRLCLIGKILGWVWLCSISETNWSQANDWSSITKCSIDYEFNVTSLDAISILHQLFWCRYSNSRDIAESSPCSSRHAARATRRACLQAGSMIDFRTFAYVRLCLIGKILGWVWLCSISETNWSQANDWSSITKCSIDYEFNVTSLNWPFNWK